MTSEISQKVSLGYMNFSCRHLPCSPNFYRHVFFFLSHPPLLLHQLISSGFLLHLNSSSMSPPCPPLTFSLSSFTYHHSPPYSSPSSRHSSTPPPLLLPFSFWHRYLLRIISYFNGSLKFPTSASQRQKDAFVTVMRCGIKSSICEHKLEPCTQ